MDEAEGDLTGDHLAPAGPGGEHVGAAHEVAAEDEATRGVDEQLALLGALVVAEELGVDHEAVVDEAAGLSGRYEAEFAHGDHELGHEGVVEFDDADVLGPDARHLVGPLGGDAVGVDAGEPLVVAAAAGLVGLVGRADAFDPDGRDAGALRDLFRPFLGGEDEGPGAFGVHAGFEQAQEGGDDPARVHDLFDRDGLQSALGVGVAVARVVEDLDDLRPDQRVADVVGVLVVVGQADLHVGVGGRGAQGVLVERVPGLGDRVDHHGGGGFRARVVAVGGLFAADAENDIGLAAGHFHGRQAHGIEAGGAAIGDASAGLVGHADDAGEGTLGDGHVLEHVVVDAVDHRVDLGGGDHGVLTGGTGGLLEQVPERRLDPAAAAIRDSGADDANFSHGCLPWFPVKKHMVRDAPRVCVAVFGGNTAAILSLFINLSIRFRFFQNLQPFTNSV